jgi:hypothetical protein
MSIDDSWNPVKNDSEKGDENEQEQRMGGV